MVHTKLVVITGGPGTGKTSVIKLLKKRYLIAPESARLIIARDKHFRGKNAVQAKGLKFQEAIWSLEVKHYARALMLRHEKYLFFDRGFFDGFAYAQLGNLRDIEDARGLAHHIVYDLVFVLDPLPRRYYGNDAVRAETYERALEIHKLIVGAYRKFGYTPIRVPFDTVENRARFILKVLDKKNPAARSIRVSSRQKVRAA